MPDHDPRIVALYDEDNPDGPDHDWYRLLADEIDARPSSISAVAPASSP